MKIFSASGDTNPGLQEIAALNPVVSKAWRPGIRSSYKWPIWAVMLVMRFGHAHSRPGQVILIVDSDVHSRAHLRQMLESGRFRVLEAAHQKDSEFICKRYVGPIDLLLVETDLPKAKGYKVAQHLRSIRPGMRILYMGTQIPEWLTMQSGHSSPFLRKPISQAELKDKVEEVLGKE